MSSQRDRPHGAIWVSAAGTATSFGIIASIRQRWGRGHEIVAADINPAHLVAASSLSDRFERMPAVADPDFPSSLLERLRSNRVGFYIPILDEEIIIAAELQATLRLPEGIACHAASMAAATLCFDKLKSSSWLLQHGFPAPRTVPLQQAQWHDEPVFVKPRFGRGSIGARLVATREDFERLTDETQEFVVQARCLAPEITIDAFRRAQGDQFASACRERLEVKAGVCTKARVYFDEELDHLIERLAMALDLRGAFCVQVMRAPDDAGWLVTDINPRPGAGTRLSVAAGFDIHSAMVLDAFGQDSIDVLPRLQGERFVVRQYSEFVLK